MIDYEQLMVAEGVETTALIFSDPPPPHTHIHTTHTHTHTHTKCCSIAFAFAITCEYLQCSVFLVVKMNNK